MISQSPAIVDADSPYDPTAFADTIIRTSDNVHFYILGNFLSYVSQVFRDLFDLNRGAAVEQNEKKDGYPVIPLLDDSATLRFLLDLIHPRIEERQLDDVTLFWNVSRAAKKYCMDIIEGKLRARILTSDLINEGPFRIYAIATDLEWGDVADIAACKTLNIPLKDLKYGEELESINGASFYRFMKYRLRCEASDKPQEVHLSTVIITPDVTPDRLDSSPPPAVVDVPSDDLGCFCVTNSALTEEGGTIPVTKRISGAESTTIYTCHVVVAKGRSYNCELLPDLSRTTLPRLPCGATGISMNATFCSSTTTDLILRSSDSIDFFVIGALVRLVSPIFDEMFPLKEHGSKDGLPIIPVQESSKVLLPLLRVVYHDMDDLDTQDWELYQEIFLTIRKYKMTSIERKLRKQVETSSLILSQPLRIYILATMLGWKEVRKAAALNTLLQSLSEMSYVSELSLVTGADLYRLVRFRFKCGDEACKALEAYGFTSYGVDSWKTYSRGSRSYHPQRLDWRQKLMACPRGSTIADAYTREIEEARKRGERFDFSYDIFPRIIECMHGAEKVVEEAVSRVCFNMLFIDIELINLHQVLALEFD